MPFGLIMMSELLIKSFLYLLRYRTRIMHFHSDLFLAILLLTYTHFLMHLLKVLKISQQEEKLLIMNNYSLVAIYFQMFSIIILSFIENCYIFAKMYSKSSAADLLYVGKGYIFDLQYGVFVPPPCCL